MRKDQAMPAKIITTGAAASAAVLLIGVFKADAETTSANSSTPDGDAALIVEKNSQTVIEALSNTGTAETHQTQNLTTSTTSSYQTPEDATAGAVYLEAPAPVVIQPPVQNVVENRPTSSSNP